MKRIIDLLKGSPGTAAALADAVTAAEAERAGLRMQEQDLASARLEALMTGDDAEIDRIEAELATVQRQLDRCEVRLPELRKRHALQVAREEHSVNSQAFAEAIASRLEAAREIDDALEALGRASHAFDAAGTKLASLQNFHGARTGVDGATEIGRPNRVSLSKATRYFAPGFAAAVGLTVYPNDDRSLSDIEADFWQGVQLRLHSRRAGPADSTLEDAA